MITDREECELVVSQPTVPSSIRTVEEESESNRTTKQLDHEVYMGQDIGGFNGRVNGRWEVIRRHKRILDSSGQERPDVKRLCYKGTRPGFWGIRTGFGLSKTQSEFQNPQKYTGKCGEVPISFVSHRRPK